MGITKEKECREVIEESAALCSLAAVHVLFQWLLRVMVQKENHKAPTEAAGRRSGGE